MELRSEPQANKLQPRGTMKAIRMHVRGAPEKLVYEDVNPEITDSDLNL